jgi:Planctomycete cytochrome C
LRFGHPPRPRFVALGVGLALLFASSGPAAAQKKTRVDFERDIVPLFKSRCYQCHDGTKHKANLRLNRKASALRGGESGKPAVVPGHSQKSELVRRFTSTDDEERRPPAKEPLSAAQFKLLRDWIDTWRP